MSSRGIDLPRALLIQLARLGDLVQSLPVIAALHALHPERPLDLLCPSPLATLGRNFPGLSRVYSWDGALWHQQCSERERSWEGQFQRVNRILLEQAFPAYPVAYNLNNHPRSILAAHLLGERVIGPGASGPVHTRLSPWAEYLRHVAQHRGPNRVHLSDAFCGLCEVRPPTKRPYIDYVDVKMPLGLEWLNDSSRRPIIGLVLGAGDPERRIPVAIWSELIQECAAALPDAWILCLGGEGEREIALVLENGLPSSCGNRVVNMCGQTSLLQLVAVLSRCQWVVGSDTGPLHVGTLCGARAVGWYFARARVHETGPYGAGHYVWQHTHGMENSSTEMLEPSLSSGVPRVWPVRETLRVILGDPVAPSSGPWSLWISQHDELGTFYEGYESLGDSQQTRRAVWERLSPGLMCLAS